MSIPTQAYENQDLSKFKRGWLAALIQQRNRRGWWVYVIWLLLYSATTMMFAGDTGASAAQMWPFLIPVAILILQWVRPTLLGWAVISLPTCLYFCVGIYYAVANNLRSHPQWEYDSEGVILGSVFLAVLLGMCIALIVAARPRLNQKT